MRCPKCGRSVEGPAGHTVPRPKSVRDEHGPLGYELALRWFNGRVLVMGVFCLFWNAILLGGILMIARHPAELLCPAVCVIPFLLAGLSMLRGTLAGLLNRTLVRVADGRLTVTHGPVPWPGGLDLDVEGIAWIDVPPRAAEDAGRDPSTIKDRFAGA